jgi:hypothetical protein
MKHKLFTLKKLLNPPAPRMACCFVLTGISFDASLGPPGEVKDKIDVVAPTSTHRAKFPFLNTVTKLHGLTWDLDAVVAS